MNRSLGKRMAATTAILALGGLGVVAAQAPASASTFSAGYSCTLPLTGAQAVTISGSLTGTPNPTTAGSATAFALHIGSLSLSSPLAINSWTATADVNVSGAESAAFQVTGSGGAVPANSPITGDLAGSWTPSAAGTDSLSGGNVSLTANVAILGNVTVPCTPTGTPPVAETLTVG